ncbi:restriction endonuclease subunit S [Colwellia sp. BRX10-4]|jgi:type I restriction enzyme S subunit|uniref:restriction endonuclease subunit S n=1 Tax=Colwellia sp. BRX10-4 TaxID=2759843 RepID=UPI0015F5911E|nr:restriction endonuclease subunit S [Colwellia sp. BRX10-4]MBA6397679.1 restriction endonuclease subunit S [Colwellia sp. BRX10-4]
MQYNAYSEYQPSKLSWLVKVPKKWEVKKLKFICSFGTGWTPPTKVDHYFNDDNLWATIGDMESKYIEHTSSGISDEAAEKFGMVKVPKGALLYSFKLSVGKVAFVTKPMYTNEAIFYVLPADEYSIEYLYYLLPVAVIQNANENIYGAKILNQERIKNAYLVFPPIQQQQKIAAFLDYKTQQIDQLIKKKKKLIEKLEEQCITVITQTLTKGIDENTKLKPSDVDWLGDVPEHWELRRLKECSKLISKGTTPSTEGHEIFEQGPIRFIKAENISNGHITNLPENYITEETNNVLKRSQLFENDVLFVIAGATLGKVACIENHHLPCNTNQAVAFIRPSEITYSQYLFYWLQSSFIKEMTWLFAVTSAQPNLAMGVLGNFSFPLPPKDEQQEIIQYLDDILKKLDGMILKARSTIEKLEEYRSTIITSAVTGKINVLEIELPKAMA